MGAARRAGPCRTAGHPVRYSRGGGRAEPLASPAIRARLRSVAPLQYRQGDQTGAAEDLPVPQAGSGRITKTLRNFKAQLRGDSGKGGIPLAFLAGIFYRREEGVRAGSSPSGGAQGRVGCGSARYRGAELLPSVGRYRLIRYLCPLGFLDS